MLTETPKIAKYACSFIEALANNEQKDLENPVKSADTKFNPNYNQNALNSDFFDKNSQELASKLVQTIFRNDTVSEDGLTSEAFDA